MREARTPWHSPSAPARNVSVSVGGIWASDSVTVMLFDAVPAADDTDLPLLGAGLQPALAANSLWSHLVRGLDEKLFPSRAAASLAAFRDLLVALTDIARQDSVSITIGKILDRTDVSQIDATEN